MDNHTYLVRCGDCGERLVVTDWYPPVVYVRDGSPAAVQPRPYDPDWVLERHRRRTHPHR